MKRDFYDILDIPENASPTWIVRAYQKRLLAIEQDASLKAKKRAASIAEINEAHRILTDAALRTAYDAELLQAREAANKPSPMSLVLRIALIVGIPLVGIGTYHYFDSQAKARAQQEQAEQAAENQRQEAQRKRIENERLAAIERDRLERVKAEQERIENQRLAHDEEMRTRRFIAAPTLEQIARDKLVAEAAERTRQMQDELDRRKAQAELERQKRFLREAGQR